MSAVGVSVVICAYTLRRWHQLRGAVASVLAQSTPASEVIVVIDHCPELLDRARGFDPRVRVLPSSGPPGLSGARNTGVVTATGTVVAFLDDDAVAGPDWLEELGRHYAEADVVGVGGHVVANWETSSPRWFPAEMLWVVGCSYRGQPTVTAEVRNPIGANMSYRRAAILDVGGFSSHLGRIGSAPVGCEETELSIRIARLYPSTRVLLEPRAVVHHHVPPERAHWSYLRRRCWAEGISKARVAQLSDPRRALATERAYVARILPSGVASALGGVLTGRDPAGLWRALAILTGLAFTTAGYLTGRAAGYLPHRIQSTTERNHP